MNKSISMHQLTSLELNNAKHRKKDRCISADDTAAVEKPIIQTKARHKTLDRCV